MKRHSSVHRCLIRVSRMGTLLPTRCSLGGVAKAWVAVESLSKPEESGLSKHGKNRLVTARCDTLCARISCGALIKEGTTCVASKSKYDHRIHYYHVKCFTYADGTPIFNVEVNQVMKNYDANGLPHWSNELINASNPRPLPIKPE